MIGIGIDEIARKRIGTVSNCEIVVSPIRNASMSVLNGTGCPLSLDWCVAKLTDCILKVFQLRKKGMNTLKGRSVFVIPSVSWLYPTQNSCHLKGDVFFPWGGDELFCQGEAESKFHIEPQCPHRRNRSIYLACSLSTCFPVWGDPMERPIEWRNEKGVFLSFYPHFFLLQWCSRCHGDPSTQQGGAKAP